MVKVSKIAYRVLNLCGLATFDLIVQVIKTIKVKSDVSLLEMTVHRKVHLIKIVIKVKSTFGQFEHDCLCEM